jgi:hypothetical protein
MFPQTEIVVDSRWTGAAANLELNAGVQARHISRQAIMQSGILSPPFEMHFLLIRNGHFGSYYVDFKD